MTEERELVIYAKSLAILRLDEGQSKIKMLEQTANERQSIYPQLAALNLKCESEKQTMYFSKTT